MNRKKIVVFSGAGLDKESGIKTFRDSVDGLWNNYKIEEVATPEGWRKDKQKVLEFYNERRRELPNVIPNEGHKLLASLEKEFDVINITQNVSDLLERGGSTNVIHLHGELTKARSTFYNHKTSPIDEIFDIGYKDINIGDKCPTTDSQLRPHIVWFGEYPFGVNEGYEAIRNADILLIIGTSLNIGYTLGMLAECSDECKIVYIDPDPSHYLDKLCKVIYIKKGGAEGMAEFISKLKNNEL